MIDFIGDIHGHADKLESLLNKLGYSYKNGSYSHPGRIVIFVGDYIDRGPQIIKTLEIVKSMVESENAVALLGNHEYNAICFHYQEREGGHLRKHLIKNIIQHYETLKQFQNKQEEYEAYLEWFKNLPLFYETEKFRAVHACWDINNIKFLRTVLRDDKLNEEMIIQSVEKGTPLYTALNNILKGKEIKMPAGLHFTDKEGTARTEIRIKWWEDPTKSNYKRISVEPIHNLPEIPIAINDLKNTDFYNEENKPVFFGHYWLKGNPSLYRNNICCLDYSVAKNGHLVAYRYDGEEKLDNSKLVFV
jgi:calcineurin-like phosphoesterase family protein